MSTAISAAQTTVSATTVNFGNVVVNETSATKTVTYRNTGTTTITFTTSVTGTGYAEPTACTGSLAPGAACTIGLTLKPASLGTATGSLAITATGTTPGTDSQTVALTGTGINATTLSASTVAFGNVVVGDTSAVKNVTLRNNQLVTLNISSISVPAGSGYAVVAPTSGTACGTKLAASSSCGIGLTLTPPTLGALPASKLTIVSDAGGTQTVALTGAGIAPITLSATTVAFGTVAINDTSAIKTVTLTNKQSAAHPLTFTSLNISGDSQFALDPSSTCSTSSSVPGGGTCTLALKFMPLTTGVQPNGTLTIADNTADSGQTITLTGTGGVDTALTPASLAFGSVVVGGNSATKLLTLKNDQPVPLMISGLVFGGSFALDTTSGTTTCPITGGTVSGTLSAGATCAIGIIFEPTALGATTGGGVTVEFPSPIVPDHATLSGTGTVQVAVTPASEAFGNQAVGGTSATKNVTVTNDQAVTLNFTSVTASAGFKVVTPTTGTACGSSLAAASTCTIGVAFNPSTPGAQTGALIINDSASVNPSFTVALSGTGTEPPVLSSTSVNFGNVTINTTASATVTLTNYLGGALTIKSLVLTGSSTFTLNSATTCSATAPLPAQTPCQIVFNFKPTASGPQTGTLKITTNATNSPQTVALSGTGVNSTQTPQTITFNNPGAQTVGTPLPLIATASSGLPVALTSATPTVCTVSGTTATFIAPGTCTIDANQTGNSTYAAAPQVAQSFSVYQPQTITFVNPGTQAVGTPLSLSATSTSGLTVSFSSATASVCTVSGTTATFIAPGTCTIDTNQTGNSTYAAAPQVAQSFSVYQPQTITFVNPGTQTVGTPLSLSATSTSGLTVSFASATASVCTVSGTTATFIASGICTIDANQAGNSTYAAAPQVAQNFSVNGEAQTITFANPGTQTIGTAVPALVATSTSGLTVNFVSATTGVCTVAGTAVALVSPGTCTIDANQTGNSTYAAAPQVEQSFAVKAASYIVTVSSDDAGIASNCTPQTTPGYGSDASCGLRDAVLASAAAGGGNISFDVRVFPGATTITLTNGTLNLPPGTMIVGPVTDGLTLDGGGVAPVVTVATGVTGVVLSNLTIQYGNSPSNGGGVVNKGVLTLTDATISANSASGNGGGIENDGTLTLINDTITGNTTSGNGGGINNTSALMVSNSTVSGNSAGAASGGGGLYTSGGATVTLGNDILSGNTSAGMADDFDGAAYTDYGGNLVGVSNGSLVLPLNGSPIQLAPLADYGGSTWTMIPLPGSPAICAGALASIAAGVTADQRGLPNTNTSYPGYGSAACVDAGAVQTNYSLIFSSEPPSSVTVNANFVSAVTLDESGRVFQPVETIPLTLNGTGNLSGGSAATSNGVANYTLHVDTAGPSDTLSAKLILNGAVLPAATISATSTSLAVNAGVLLSQTITFSNPGMQTVGSPLALSASSTSGLAVTFTSNTPGVCTVSGTAATFVASGTCTIDANQAGNSTYAAAPQVAQTFTVNGQAQTITFANPGTQTVGTPLTLSASATSGLAVAFASATASICAVSGTAATFTAPGTCTIDANQAGSSTYAAAPQVADSFTVSAAGPSATVSPATLTFAAQLVGTTSGPMMVTLTNKQPSETLHFSGASITGANSGDFSWANSVAQPCGSVAPGASCQLLVSFSPLVSGTRTAQLNISDDGSNSPQTVALTGPGNTPVSVLPGLITNFTAPVGSTSAGQTITITNNNITTAATINSFQLAGDFKVATTSCGSPSAPANPPPYVLPAGNSCNVVIQFAPTIGGTRTGQLQVNDSDPTSPQVVNLSGTGTSPLTAVSNPSVQPPALTYSAQPAGTVSGPKTVTLTNNELQSETFSLNVAGDYVVAGNNCSTGQIGSRSSCIIAIDFAPNATAANGPDNGSLTINDSAPGGTPLVVTLNGSVGIPQPAVAEVTPGLGDAGNNSLSVVITGNGYTHFNASSVITFVDTDNSTTPADITVAVPNPSATTANQITATLNIGANTASNPVTYGARNITVTTQLAGGGTETAFLNSAFTIYDPTNVHTITVVNPSSGAQGQTLNVGLTATGTNFIQGTTIVNFGTGITVNSLSITDATDAVANITISNTTAVGYRTIAMATGGEYASASSTAFQVTPNNATLTSVSERSTSNVPVVEPQSFGGPIYLTATGTHFLQDATQVSIGGGVIVGDVTVTSPTTATAQVALSSATPGTYSVTVLTGGEIATLPNSFTVTGSTPALLSVSPSSGKQGQNGLNIVITGNAFTNFSNTGGNTLTLNMTGLIQVTNLVVNNSNQVTATVNIDPTMPVGSITANLISDDGGTTINYPFAFTVNASAASIVSVTPPSVPQGGQATLTLVGLNTIWSLTSNPVTSAAFYPEPVPAEPIINELQVQNATDATLNITVPPGTPVGSYPFYLATGGQVVSSSISVYANTPSMTMSPANGLVPTSGVNSFSVTFSGQFTNWSEGNADPNQNTQVPVISGEGVTISNFVVTSQLSATATLSIAAGAATNVTSPYNALCGYPGNYARSVTVTTGAQVVNTCFNVTSTPVEIIAINPPRAPQFTTLSVQIVGLNTHFCDNVTTACPAGVNPSTVLFGPEITVNNVSVQDNTHLTASITTAFTFEGNASGTVPGYQTVYVNTGNEQVTGSEQILGNFLVDAPASPTLLSVVPSNAAQGSTVDVTITGSVTNWVQGTTEAILGAGVTVANLTITSPTTATGTISVSPTAPVGPNSVTMITGFEVAGGTAFSVTPSNAYIQSVGPVCNAQASLNTSICEGTGSGVPWQVTQLQTTTLSVIGVGTHWVASSSSCGTSCGTSFSFGGGVVIDSLNITSPTTAAVQITVLSNSPVGFVSLTTNTGGESVTLQQAIDIEEGSPTLLAISPISGSQGSTITGFQVLGRFTHFCDNVATACAPGYSPTQLSFSGVPGITASNVRVVDNDTLTATIAIDPTSYLDYVGFPWCGHALTVTTPSNEQVSTSPILDNFCVTQGPAQINSVSVPAIPAGNTGTITIVGSATHFQQGVTAVIFCYPNLPCDPNSPAFRASFVDPNLTAPTADVVVTDATHLTATIAANTSVTPGTKTVTVMTFGEVASEQFAFSVLPDQPVLTQANPARVEQGQQLYLDPAQPGIDVVLTGQYTHFSSQSTVTFGPGIVVNSVTQQSATQITANITIDPLSYTGGRTVTVTTPGVPCSQQPVNFTYSGCSPGQQTGTGSEIVSANTLQIVPGPAIIKNVSPNTGNEGQEVVFNITGTDTHWQQNFTQFYIAGGGTDLTINSVIINSATSATVDMNISPTANPGARSIYISTAGETLTDSGAFVVTGGVPAVAYISPNNALNVPTTPVEVTIHGIYTLWAPGTTTLNFDPSITVSNFQVDDNFNISAVLSVSSTATLGYHVFSVVTGTQVLTGNFLVVAAPGTPGAPPPPAPFIWSETPSTGLPGQTMNVYFTGLYTHWDPNANTGTQFSFGSGIQVNTCQVLSETSALCNITITASTAQTNLVVFTTGTETESADFNVVIAQPTLSVVDPGSAIQGATNITVNILGQFTAFDSTTTFSFGPNITVVGAPTILGPTVATQTISIPQLAPTGGNAVVATTSDAPVIAQVVGGASFSITPSLALISVITPNVAQQGATGFVVEVTGQNTHWDGSTIFRFGSGITVTNTQVNTNTDATLTLSVPALAPEGPTYVSASTGGEVASINDGFVVSAGTPYLLSSGPGSLPQQGSATFTILAQETGWTAAAPPVVSYGAGVNIGTVTVTSPQSLTVTGSVQATTPVGYRNLTVTSGTQVLSLPNVLYISPGPAIINSVSQNSGGQGVNLPAVQINGTNANWVQGVTTLTFPGALINGFTVNSPTSITANITVSAYAPAGQVSVTATTLGEVAAGVNVFTVTQTQPELLAVVPNSAPQGWTTQNITLTGDFTHFCDNITTTCPTGYTPSAANFGAGIRVNSVTANGFTSLVANVTVEPAANLGYRNVSVVTGAETVQITNGFNVTVGPAAISNLNPASGKQNTSLTVLATGSQTHFCDNVTTTCQNGSPVTVAQFGGGIQVTGISVVDANHANVTITIPSSATLGQYNVTLTTGGEVATILGGFQVLGGTPVLTSVNPATGTMGITENVTLTGLFTNFVNGTSVASFSPAGIKVNSTTVTNATTAVANITISTTAAIGSYTPTVTTGSQVASETGGFTVLAGVPALTVVSPSSAQAGTTANVVINGVFTTFQQGFTTVTFGDGITTNFVTVNSLTQLTANITIPSTASVGNTYISETTNGQNLTLNNGFAVTAGTPVITVINPNYGNPGQANLAVAITGQYTNWINGTTVATFTDGIAVNSTVVSSPTQLTANITIPANATLGPADVTTTTGGEVESVPAGFTVQAAVIPPPSVALLSPGPYSVDMPINSDIIVEFSQPMMRSTINTTNITLQQYSTNGSPGYPYIPGTVSLDATGRIMTFTPSSLLPVNSTFNFQMNSSIQDATGNTFPGFSNFLYTTFSADSTPPTVTAVNPPANATNIGTNVPIQLEFSVPMNQTTDGGMTVTSSGGMVAGSFSWNSAISCNCGPGNILTFTPTSPLTPNTVYTVTYSNTLTDTAGNALTPGSFTFTTGASADTAYIYSGSDFTSGIGNVGTNFAPRMNYSKPVNPIDINTSTLILYNYDSGKYIHGTVSVAPNGMSAVFTPSALLLPGTSYTLYQATGYYGADGNYLYGVYDYFTTGNGQDQTAPTVQLISPPNSATGVPLNGQVTALFSAPIDPDSVANAVTITPAGGSPIPATVTLASDQVTLTLAPTLYLQPGTQYTVQITGYQDMVGNPGTTFTSTFSTVSGVSPLVVSTGLDASGNLITTGGVADAHWTVTPGDSSTPQPAVIVTPANVAWSPDWSPYGYSDGPLASVITINANSVLSATTLEATYSTTFNLTGYSLTNLCLVGALQGDPYGTLMLNGTAITGQIVPYQSLYPFSVSLSSANPTTNTLTFQTTSEWDGYGGFRLEGAIQTCNSIISGALALTSSTPANGATSVATNANITLTFNHAIDAATVNSTTLPVMVGWNSNQEIAGTYQVNGNQVIFTPDSPFPTNTTIYVGACGGPLDLAGDSLGACYTQETYFTTGGTATPASTPFQVLAFSPAANATSVGLRAPVTATFNRSLNLGSVNSNDFALFAGDGQSLWCSGGSYSHSQDDATIQFNCNTTMPASTVMTALLGSGLTDWQGNGLVPYTSQFTTGQYDSNTNGSVITERPGIGASGISVNEPLLIFVNLPISAGTAPGGIEVAQNNVAVPGTVQVADGGYTLEFTPSVPWMPGALIQWWLTGTLLNSTFNTPITGGSQSGYFNVASSTSTLVPAVQTMIPASYSSGNPLNSFIDLLFNTPLNPGTVADANIYLAAASTGCGGLHTPVTYVSGLPANEVRMVPSSALIASNFYYLCIGSGLQSATSVPASPYQPYFYAGTATDTTLPTIVSAVPYNGSTGVGVNIAPGVVLSKAIDPVSVNGNTFQVTQRGTPLAGNFWFNSNDTRVEFVPNAPLPPSTNLAMTINGVLDLAGHPITFTSNFTTAPGPAVNAPTIVWTSVGSNGSIPINGSITVQFSESMDVTTFSSASGGNFYLFDEVLSTYVPATLSWSADQSTAYLVPSSPLAAGRQYNFVVNGGTDLAGNAVQGESYYIYAEFTTASSAPTVIAFNPFSGATGVGTNTIIEAQFSGPIDPNTISGVKLTTGGTTVPTAPSVGSGNTVVQLVPATQLAPNTTYVMTVAGVKDSAGNLVGTVNNSFTTGATYDINAATVVSIDPANNATTGTNIAPKMVFNKPLNPTMVSNSTFAMYLNDTGQWIPLSVVLSPNGMEVTMTPQIPLLPNTLYRYYAGTPSALQDEDGNNVAAGWYYFYTGSGAVTTGPTVTVVPQNSATGIPLNAQVYVTVSAPVDPTSWSQTSIQLLNGSAPVAGTVSFTNTQTLTFVPASNLSPTTTYQVMIPAGGFTDTNGNGVVPYSGTFTTGAAAATGGLTLVSTNITNGSTVTNNLQPIILTFSQILDPTTVNSSTLKVMNGWNGSLGLAGTYSVNGTQVTFTPTSPYPAGATITVGDCGGPTDILGDVFLNGACYGQELAYFTVSTASPDTAPLQVVSVSPASGAINVYHDQPVSVTFNKSASPGSAGGNSAILYAGQDPQDNGSVTWSADNRTMTFNIGALYDGTTYTIALPAGGITDMSGNPLASPFTSTFTTTVNPAASNGSVVSTNPASNATGVPTYNLLTLYVNRQVNASTLPGNVKVTVNGVVYPGTVQAAADGYEVQYTPNTPFPNGATIQWWFSNAQDIYGNTFNGASGTFYTVAAVNSATAQPVVVAVSPSIGSSTNVPTNAEVDLEFSQPLNPSTVNSTNVLFYDGATGYLPSSAYTVSQPYPNVIRVTPVSPYTLNTWYYVCANSNVLGTNGVAIPGSCWTTYFYPGYGPDTSPGKVGIGPPNGVINVGTNAYIRLQFSKPVDRTTVNTTNVQVTTGGNPIPGTFTFSITSGNDLIGANFYPANPLPASSPIEVSTSGLLDYAGNTFTAASSTFSTAALPDYTTPSVTFDFAYGTTGIGTNASFTCRYSEAMDPSSVTPGNTYVYSYATNAANASTYTWSSDLMSVTMTPTAPLYANAQYEYQCYSGIDLTGNGQSNNYALFYTGNGPVTAGPVLLQANPPNGFTNVPLNSNTGPWAGSSMGLLFNEPVAGNSLGNITLTPTNPPGSPMPIAVYPEYGNTIVWVQLPYALQPNTTYTYNVTGVTDYNGNPMTPATSTFTTGTSFDFTNPTTSSTVPVNGTTNVAVNTPLSVTFSKAMDPVLISSSQIYLQTHNTQTIVPTTLSISADYQTVSLAPTVPLASNTIYDIVYWPNNWYLYDIAGNYDPYYGVLSTFTTGTATAVNGICGSANGGTFATAPNANLCSAGIASPVTDSGSWTWTCNGQYGGSNASCSANVSLANSCVPQQSGLVSWWPGNDNANDLIGGNNGALENGTSFALGEVGDAFSLNGSNQFVLIGQPVPANLQIQNAMTYSAWIYVTTYNQGDGQWATILGSWNNSLRAGAGLFMAAQNLAIAGVPPGALALAIWQGNGSYYQVETTTQLPLNQWTLVTASIAANQPAQLYVNGVAQPILSNGSTGSWNGTVNYNSSAWFAIGQQEDLNRAFTGLIDETQVYNTALSTAQVQAIYNAGGAGVCP